MTPQERFAINLRRARAEAGVSQEELGYMCDLHRTEVSLLERAGREPRLATIVKLARAMNVQQAQLRDGATP
jgi:transcriptional regulator with XRE-family HTH domain